MQTIMPAHGNTLKILGKGKDSADGYRLMTYVSVEKVDSGYLLFHTLTRELLLLTEEEYADLYGIPALYEKWFIVPGTTDDMRLADKVRFIRRTVQKKPTHITSYTILTTTDCNARCFYCYELGRSRIPMRIETAHKAADYIVKNCGGEKVHLTWFGGEPLFHTQPIDIICADLREKNVEYRSTMITNGYLFDDDLVKRAVDAWKLRQVQITLDGTEAVYNRCKAFIYRGGSPYQTVMANIQRLLAAEIGVSIRMNLDRHNADDLFDLVEELHDRFSGYKNLFAYSHVLFEFSGHHEKIRAAEERRELYRRQKFLTDRLKEYGLFASGSLKKSLPLTMCMADSGISQMILPNGEIGLCETFTEDHFIGHLDTGVVDADMVKYFQMLREKEERCSSCVCYPECIRLQNCIEQKRCFEEIQEEKIQALQASMRVTYQNWLNRTETEEAQLVNVC